MDTFWAVRSEHRDVKPLEHLQKHSLRQLLSIHGVGNNNQLISSENQPEWRLMHKEPYLSEFQRVLRMYMKASLSPVGLAFGVYFGHDLQSKINSLF
jgi:hypothetical protein